MEALEKESKRFINPSFYYIVRVKVEGLLITEDIIVNLLKNHNQPVAIYYHINDVIFIFTNCNDFDTHQYDGDHHTIVSVYACMFSKLNQSVNNVFVNIIEFSTQIQVVSYIGVTIFQLSQSLMKTLSNGVITDELLQFKTEKELVSILLEQNEDWDSINNFDKYGSLVKLKKRKRVGEIPVVLSKAYDARENKKYIDFIFR